jgi:hypothetical protein
MKSWWGGSSGKNIPNTRRFLIALVACLSLAIPITKLQNDIRSRASEIDKTPPTIQLIQPDSLAIQSGASLNITADASDDVAITTVEFWGDGELKCVATREPYSCSLIVPPDYRGNYTVEAKAYDSSGNTSSDNFTLDVQ